MQSPNLFASTRAWMPGSQEGAMAHLVVRWIAVGGTSRALSHAAAVEDAAMAAFLRHLAASLPAAVLRGRSSSFREKMAAEAPEGLGDQLAIVSMLATTVGDIWSLLFPSVPTARDGPLHLYNLLWDRVGALVSDECRIHMKSRRDHDDRLLGPVIQTLSSRLVILEALATVVRYSSCEMDIMRVVWGCVAAHQALEEISKLCVTLDETGSLSRLSGFDLHNSLPCTQACALGKLFWSLFARVSLLFESALEPSRPLEAEEGPSAPPAADLHVQRSSTKEPTGFFSSLFKRRVRPSSNDLTTSAEAEQRRDSLGGSFKAMCAFPLLSITGCTDLDSAIRSLINCCEHQSTFFIASNSRTRPGKRCWHQQQFNLFARDDDDAGSKGGMASWCMCIMLPSWAGHKVAGGHLTRIGFNLASVDDDDARKTGSFLSFHNERTVYFIHRSPSDVDGGRLYFGLIVDAVASGETRMPQPEMLERSARVMESEKAYAMRCLQAVQDAWGMSPFIAHAQKLTSSAGKA